MVILLDNGLASTRAEWLRTMNGNVENGAIRVRLAAPVLKARGGGAIVNLWSIASTFANAGPILYPAKAAIRQITKHEALDLSDSASRVTGADIAIDGGYSVLPPDRGLGAKWMVAEFDS